MKLEKRSKEYFRDAASEITCADDSQWPKAARTLILSMDVMQPKGKVCISLGCGWGRFLRAYAARDARLVIGADINVENLFKCKQIQAHLVRCDLENLPIRDNSIEAMECVATVERLPNPQKLVGEIQRISTNDGVSFVTWASFDWSRAFVDSQVRHRLLMTARDVTFDLLPAAITERMASSKLRIPYSGSYGLYHHRGFSLSDISKIYERASMRISWTRRLADESIIAVTASPARGNQHSTKT